jgi:hypothetical protein
MLSAMTLAIMQNTAKADDVTSGGCIGTWTTFSCVTTWGTAGNPFVRIVPQPSDDAARKDATERDHKWTDRCHPVIKPDRYGVGRYEYSASGCEFGADEP